MSYSIYTSQGILLNLKDYGEADRVYRIFTKDLGLLVASAKSVRKQASKAGPHIQPFSISNYSFVRGEEMWRITTVDTLTNWKKIFEHKVARQIYSRVIKLLDKLLQGEEAHPALFNILSNGFEFMEKNTESKNEYLLEALETAMVWKITNSLGYAIYNHSILMNEVFDIEQLEYVLNFKTKIVSEINKSLETSHLV